MSGLSSRVSESNTCYDIAPFENMLSTLDEDTTEDEMEAKVEEPEVKLQKEPENTDVKVGEGKIHPPTSRIQLASIEPDIEIVYDEDIAHDPEVLSRSMSSIDKLEIAEVKWTSARVYKKWRSNMIQSSSDPKKKRILQRVEKSDRKHKYMKLFRFIFVGILAVAFFSYQLFTYLDTKNNSITISSLVNK